LLYDDSLLTFRKLRYWSAHCTVGRKEKVQSLTRAVPVTFVVFAWLWLVAGADLL